VGGVEGQLRARPRLGPGPRKAVGEVGRWGAREAWEGGLGGGRGGGVEGQLRARPRPGPGPRKVVGGGRPWGGGGRGGRVQMVQI
jgi:hypothetical protein